MLCMLLMFPLLLLALKRWQDKDFVGLEMLYGFDSHSQQTIISSALDMEVIARLLKLANFKDNFIHLSLLGSTAG